MPYNGGPVELSKHNYGLRDCRKLLNGHCCYSDYRYFRSAATGVGGRAVKAGHIGHKNDDVQESAFTCL